MAERNLVKLVQVEMEAVDRIQKHCTVMRIGMLAGQSSRELERDSGCGSAQLGACTVPPQSQSPQASLKCSVVIMLCHQANKDSQSPNPIL